MGGMGVGREGRGRAGGREKRGGVRERAGGRGAGRELGVAEKRAEGVIPCLSAPGKARTPPRGMPGKGCGWGGMDGVLA